MENDPKRKNKLEQNDGGQYEKVKYKFIPEADDDYIQRDYFASSYL